MNELPPSVVKESVCAPFEGSAWGLPFLEVWINHFGDCIHPARLDFVEENGRRVLSKTAVLSRRPVGEDYEAIMLSYIKGDITKEESVSLMKAIQKSNLVVFSIPYEGYFTVDRRN